MAAPPHQDYFYMRGIRHFYTAWFSIFDCPVQLGGLALLRGSHKNGRLAHMKMDGVGGMGVNLDKDICWDVSNYGVGDVVIFHKNIIHKGIENNTNNKLRISLDTRLHKKMPNRVSRLVSSLTDKLT